MSNPKKPGWSRDEENLLRDIWGGDLFESVRGRLGATEEGRDHGQSTQAPHGTGGLRLRRDPHAPSEKPPEAPPEKEILADDLVGQHAAKRSLAQVIAMARVNEERKKRGIAATNTTLHAVFSGSPGTGKTTFARFYAQEVRKLGLLESGHLVEVSRPDLVAEYAGQTAGKTAEVVKKAFGGILFIDEAYALKQGKDDLFGQEAIDTLIKLIEDHRDELIVILAGYTEEMREFLHHNTGLKSRIPNELFFEDFTDDELAKILDIFLRKASLEASAVVRRFAIEQVSQQRKGRSFGNAREVRNLFERALAQQSMRLSKGDLTELSREELSTLLYSDFTLDPDDTEGTASTADGAGEAGPMDRLLALHGLDVVKGEIRRLADYIRVAKARSPGQGIPDLNLHMVFAGNPGTGKTTVARLLGAILSELGLLSSGHLIEVDRSEMVGGFLGQTALKVRERVTEALGGILFVDEAYALARSRGDSYGQEAIDTLLKCMEDERGRLVVVLAGYPSEMDGFLATNPGLRSRIANHYDFGDYDDDTLVAIAGSMAAERGYVLGEGAEDALRTEIAHLRDSSVHFGNAREVRNLLEAAYRRQATRILALGDPEGLGAEVLNEITSADLVATSSADGLLEDPAP